MISKPFQFYRPADLSEALSLLEQDLGEVRLLAGGMSLVPAMNLGLAQPDAVISLNHVHSLAAVARSDGNLTLGALVRHRRIETDEMIRGFCPLLNEAAGLIADVQVRHRGTIGGSLAHADPAANYVPVILALEGRLKLVSGAGEQWMAASDFFEGPFETKIGAKEVLVQIDLPVQTNTQSSAYYRLAHVHGAFATANAAAVITQDGTANVVVGGITGKPIVVKDYVGPDVSRLIDRVGEAVHQSCKEPLEHLYGSAEYRRSMARVAAQRALYAALQRANRAGKEGGP